MALVKMIMPNEAPMKPLAMITRSIGASLFMSNGGRPNRARPWFSRPKSVGATTQLHSSA